MNLKQCFVALVAFIALPGCALQAKEDAAAEDEQNIGSSSQAQTSNSWRRSCFALVDHRYLIEASCKKRNGNSVYARFDFPYLCPSDITNCDGVLRCGGCGY
jgi:outer membrane biogenesis lipoprotein LolB